jgi:hypothetical protein
LRDSLQSVLDRRAPQIQAILKQYGVPVFPIQADKDDDARKESSPPVKAAADSARATTR